MRGSATSTSLEGRLDHEYDRSQDLAEADEPGRVPVSRGPRPETFDRGPHTDVVARSAERNDKICEQSHCPERRYEARIVESDGGVRAASRHRWHDGLYPGRVTRSGGEGHADRALVAGRS